MTKHPQNRAERLKLKNDRDRRKRQIKEAIKRQESEDELKNSPDLEGDATVFHRDRTAVVQSTL